MSSFGFSGVGTIPGLALGQSTFEAEFGWGRIDQLRYTNGQIDGAARDAANTPTTILRHGLLLGMVTATGKLKQYDPAAVDGTQVVHSILVDSFRVTDLDATNQDLFVMVCVGGPVKGARLIGVDLIARTQMQGRFYFDDDFRPLGRIFSTRARATDLTLTAADNGTRFTTLGAAGAVAFTLPNPTAALRGMVVEFYNEVDQNLTVTTASGSNVVAFNNLTASSVALSTSGNKIGSGFRMTVNSDGTKWLAERIGYGTVTVA